MIQWNEIFEVAWQFPLLMILGYSVVLICDIWASSTLHEDARVFQIAALARRGRVKAIQFIFELDRHRNRDGAWAESSRFARFRKSAVVNLLVYTAAYYMIFTMTSVSFVAVLAFSNVLLGEQNYGSENVPRVLGILTGFMAGGIVIKRLSASFEISAKAVRTSEVLTELLPPGSWRFRGPIRYSMELAQYNYLRQCIWFIPVMTLIPFIAAYYDEVLRLDLPKGLALCGVLLLGTVGFVSFATLVINRRFVHVRAVKLAIKILQEGNDKPEQDARTRGIYDPISGQRRLLVKLIGLLRMAARRVNASTSKVCDHPVAFLLSDFASRFEKHISSVESMQPRLSIDVYDYIKDLIITILGPSDFAVYDTTIGSSTDFRRDGILNGMINSLDQFSAMIERLNTSLKIVLSLVLMVLVTWLFASGKIGWESLQSLL